MYKLSMKKEFNTPVSKLFDAWCQEEIVKQWFAPGEMTIPEANIDMREGGKYRIVMQDSEGNKHIIGGKYHEIIPNSKLVFSWQWENSPITTIVKILFKALDNNKSSLELVHSEFHEEESRDHHNDGWKGCLTNLTKAI
ncbi:MAG: SRPBCC domain-containing protein [Alcanivoracaceae bacterium]|nr:SRPBCC domain-containing protein [Alcanivoracaceae bacterium]